MNVNVAFNTSAAEGEAISDTAFDCVSKELLVPLLTSWGPSVVLFSAGYDAAKGDPLGNMEVEHGFARMVADVAAVCPDIVMILEGGYNSACVAQGVLDSIKALLGLQVGGLNENTTHRKWTQNLIKEVAKTHIKAGSKLVSVMKEVLSGLEVSEEQT